MQPSPTAGTVTVHCPECGAPVRMRAGIMTAVCEYCDSTLVRTDANIDLIGKVSHLLDTGSPILLGSHGRFGGTPFDVIGRLQVRYERGTWNEWYLAFADGTNGWLSDAQGRFAIMRRAEPTGPLPAWDALVLGETVRLGGKPFLVVDRRAAAYQGAEGELPFVAQPGVVFHAADLANDRGQAATLDFGTDPAAGAPDLYLGTFVRLAAIELAPLRRFEGWPRAG